MRGFSLANVSFVEGEHGVIVIDPLQFTEHARAAIALYRAHRGDRPVTAVIYTHSHRDHYGGVRGVIGPDDVARRGVPVIAPSGFTEASFTESMLAGVPMRRRAMFQFGWGLEPGPMGHVDCGLGKAVGGGGDGFIAPTMLIEQPVERHLIDGVDDRVPPHAGHGGSGRHESASTGPARAEPGRERVPHDAQPVPVARREDP